MNLYNSLLLLVIYGVGTQWIEPIVNLKIKSNMLRYVFTFLITGCIAIILIMISWILTGEF